MSAPVMIPRANRMKDLFESATVDIFAGCGGWSIGTEQAYVKAGYVDRYIDLMINHWDTAVGVHEANHPLTMHLHASVLEVDPAKVLPGRELIHLHASPDCTDHSKAKGGKPRRKEIRALADVVIVWGVKRRPLVLTLENVEEFQQWGPLLDNGQPDPQRRGQEFQRWCNELRDLGYVVEHKILKACDYGAPTTRKRLFVIARCDGRPIVWPKPTHGKAPLLPYRAAAECIDWSIPMLSIFATPKEAKAWAKEMNDRGEQPGVIGWFTGKHGKIGVPRRPLKPKTLSRIAGGLVKYVINAKKPFIVDIQNYGWNGTESRDVDKPMPTVAAGPKGGGFAVVDAKVSPYTVPNLGEAPGQTPRSRSVEDPMPTVTGANTGANLVAATLSRYNGAKGSESRCNSPDEPLRTQDTQNRFGVVAANIVRVAHGDESAGGARRGEPTHSVDQPLGTITGSNDFAIAAAHLTTLNHGGKETRATDARDPLPTVTAANDARTLVAALVTKHYGGVIGNSADKPLDTVTAVDHNALTCAHLMKFRGDSVGTPADEPMPTVTSGAGAERDAGAAHALGVSCVHLSQLYGTNKGTNGDPSAPAPTITGDGNHSAVVSASAVPFLIGTGGAAYAAKPKSASDPMNTVMVNDRREIVAAFLAAYYGEGSGKVGHTPADPLPTAPGHARFGLITVKIDGTDYVITDIAMRMLTPRELARAQGFPDDYIIDRTADGKKVSKADQVKLIGNAVPPVFPEHIVTENIINQGMLDPISPEHRRRIAALNNLTVGAVV